MKFRSVGITIIILLFHSSVWGDCAWVLWQATSSKSGLNILQAFTVNKADWEIVMAYPTFEGCLTLLETGIDSTKKAAVKTGVFKNVLQSGDQVVAYWRDEAKATVYHFRCLPESVDPRK